jgi:hypothetical protein
MDKMIDRRKASPGVGRKVMGSWMEPENQERQQNADQEDLTGTSGAWHGSDL